MEYLKNYDYESAELLKETYLNLGKEQYDINTREPADAKIEEYIANNFALVLSNINTLNINLGKFNEAIKNNEEILNIYKKINDVYGIIIALNNLCSIYNRIHSFEKSINYCNQSINLIKNNFGKNSDLLSEPITNYGIALQNKSLFTESIEYFQNALSIELNNKKRNETIATLYLNIGTSFGYLENWDNSIKFLKKSLEIREEIFGKNSLPLAGILNSLGMAYSFNNEFELGEKFILRGLKIREEHYGENNIHVIRSKMNLSAFYTATNNRKKASNILEELLEPLKKQYGLFNQDVFYTLASLSSYYSGDGENFNKSEEYGLQAIEIGEKILDPLDDILSTTYLVLSRLYMRYEKYKLSQKYSLKAAKLEADRNLHYHRLGEHENIKIHSNSIFYHIENLVALKSINHPDFKQTKYEDSFNLMQSISNIKASSALKKSSLRIFQNNESLNMIIKEIQDLELKKREIQTEKLENILNNNNSLDDLNNIVNNYDKNLKKIINNEISKNNLFLKNNYTKYSNLIEISSISIDEIQKLIDENEVLISFYIHSEPNIHPMYDINEMQEFNNQQDSTIFLTIITKKSFNIKLIFYNYNELRDDVLKLRYSLEGPYLRDFDFQLSNKLYKLLFNQIENEIKNKKQLLIVPDKVLF